MTFTTGRIPLHVTSSIKYLCSCLHKLEALSNDLGDLFVFMLQLTQRKCDVIPLSLGLAASQTSSKLVGQLSGMFILMA